MAGTHDPGVNPEEEGIPDLQDGAPEQQRASDPQREPVPGDQPVAADAFGTTPAEQRQGQPLGDRLAAEEPDVDQDPASGTGVPDEEAGLLSEDAYISDDPYLGRPRDQDVFAHRDEDTEGLSAEEAAVHIPEDQDRV